MKVQELGAFIREQRRSAQMSLRGLSNVAGVSLPYLSQIERGLRKPSADIMQAIAKALRVSSQTLYVRAGILDEEPPADVTTAIMGDSGLTDRQKQALLAVYVSFRDETDRRRAARSDAAPGSPDNNDVRSGSTGRRRASGRPQVAMPDAKPSPDSHSASRSRSSRAHPKGGATT